MIVRSHHTIASRPMRASRPTNAGFTLLELLVVVLIIGLLTGIVAPRFFGQVARSEITAARAQMESLEKALEAFAVDTGRYPTTTQGLNALVAAPGDTQRWRGPYLRGALPLDPWGQTYQYRSPGNAGRDYDLSSFGPDKAPGGSGDNADISR